MISWQAFPYLLPLGVAALISAFLAIYAWWRRGIAGAQAFVWLMASVFIWTACYTLELAAGELESKILWNRAQFIGIAFLPLAWLSLCCQFAGRGRLLARRNMILLGIIPALTLVMAWTNEAHGLMWRDLRLYPVGPYQKIDSVPGPWFWVHSAYGYLLMSAGVLVLFTTLARSPRLYRRQAFTLLLGMVFPFAANLLYLIGLSPFPHLDLTPFAFNLSGVIMAWGLFRFRIFDLVPYARDAVLEDMREGVVVLDDRNRVVDLNVVAQAILGRSPDALLGQSAEQAFSLFPGLVEGLYGTMEAQEEVALSEGSEKRHYEIRVSPLYDPHSGLAGRLMVWSDITARKQAEALLSERNEMLSQRLKELTILHAIASIGVEANSEDKLIERATQVIGERLYSDNFGLLLLDEATGNLRHHPSYRHKEASVRDLEILPGQGICGRVVAEGKPLRIPDVNQEPAYLRVEAQTRSELCVPLKIGERVIGVINAESERVDAFSEADERLLTTLAGQLATAIERLRAESLRTRQTEKLGILSRTTQEIVSSLVSEQVYAAIYQAASQLVTTEVFSLALFDKRQAGIVPVYAVERGKVVEAGGILQGNGISGQVVLSGEAMLLDERDLPGEMQGHGHGDFKPPRSLLAVPLRLRDKVVGVMSCQSYRPRAYSRDDLEALITLANQAAIAIENARLFEETQSSLRETTFLSQIIAITATESDLVSALQRVCEELAQFFWVPEVGFVLFNSQLTAGQVIAEYHAQDRPGSLGLQFPLVENPAVAYLLSHGSYLAISNAETDPVLESRQDMVHGRGIKSLLLTPIIFGGEVVGFLEIDDVQPREFKFSEIQLMEKVASQVSQVLERLGLFAATREQAERMAQLAALSEALNRPLTEDEVIKGIGQAGMQLGGAERAAVYVIYRHGMVTAPWSEGLSQEYLDQVTRHIEEIPGGNLLKSTEPVLISDLESLPEKSLLRTLGREEGYRAVELWPLVYEDQVIAAIGCYYDQVHPWSDVEQEVMLAFARQASVALQNARLFDETRRRAGHLEGLNAIIAAVAAASDLQQLLETALDRTLWALQLEMGGIWVAGESIFRKLPPEAGQASADPALASQMEIPSAVVIRDWEQLVGREDISELIAGMREAQVRATITVPILSEGRRIGGLCIASAQPRAWLDEEVGLVEGVGRQIGGAVERIELLERIQDQARQVQQIIEAVPEGVILLDEDRQVVLANPVAQTFLSDLAGLKVGDRLVDLGGKPLYDLLHPESQTLWYELEIQGAVRRIFELAVQSLEGGDYSGGWVLVMRDVTQERENQARIQMHDRLATVGQLAAGIAHDFNNIMAAIVVYADLLQRDPNLTSSSRDRLAIIQNQVQRAASLIRQILDFSRRSVMEQSSLDLLPFIKELDKLLRRVLPENIRLELIYQPGVYLVNADPTRLQQVFMNLAVNARDATPNGGTLHFKLERLSLREGERPPCPDLPPGDWIRISVQDSGEGIPQDIIPHIFEPFFTTKPVGQGTGLGLAQAYGIIKQHDGYIDVHSEMGEGSTFHIYLRAQEVPREQETDESLPVEAHGAGELLLVAEDDPAARDAMRALLEAYNYQVLTASNGAEALQVYERNKEHIALVVSDVMMPVMGGMALYHALYERWPEVKMLFVTGHPIKEQDQAILQKGKVQWLQKPFSVQAFSQAVHSLLDGLEEERVAE